MRLLFLGITPDPDTRKALIAGGISVDTPKRLPDVEKDVPEPFLIAYGAKDRGALKELPRLKKRYPDAWLAVVVPQKMISDAAFQNALLECAEKDDVWLDPTWRSLLWFYLQRALSHRRLSQELKELKKDWETLKGHYHDLSSSSDKLIAQLEKDVLLAANIQRTLLPRISPEIPGVSVAVKYIPAAGLGGDYYDIFEFGDRKRYGVLVADSKTHGMAAVLLSALLKVRVEEVRSRFPDTKSFMEFINSEIQQVQPKELSSLSLLYGILDRSSLTFQYTVAGALRPVLWREGAPLELPINADPPLGGLATYNFRENQITLKPKDLLILHTDGMEAPLSQHHPSAFDKLVEILKSRHPATEAPDPLELQNELMALVDQYLEQKPLEDDLTLIHFGIDERALYVARQSR